MTICARAGNRAGLFCVRDPPPGVASDAQPGENRIHPVKALRTASFLRPLRIPRIAIWNLVNKAPFEIRLYALAEVFIFPDARI
jgi:hypothetical protein